MRRIILIILGLVFLAVAGVLAMAATRPDTFHIERRMTTSAPPDKVFAMISDFSKWQIWSPWEKLDPGMKRTVSANPAGVGATYAWDGNKDVGAGNMAITKAEAPTTVVVALNFQRPMESSNVATFTITPKDTGSDVVWAMDGPMPFISKVFDVIVGLDAVIGPDFERGLTQLKAEAEKG